MNDSNILAVVSQTDELATWSDNKKKDFVKTFGERVRVAQALELLTAASIRQIALHNQYISQKHCTEPIYFNGDSLSGSTLERLKAIADKSESPNYPYSWTSTSTFGARPISELREIARQRAEATLEGLPPIKKAVAVIAPDVAKMMDERDEIVKKGQVLTNELNELSGELKMSDLDQNMTIGMFRTMVKERNKRVKLLAEKLQELGAEGSELENTINRKLYAGLPGLSEAIIEVIKRHEERVVALAALGRRTEERVMFGDSDAAMEILKNFEKDEQAVSQETQKLFDGAVAKLKEAGTKKTAKKKLLAK